jgi:dTDP-4-dehydrorhamnose 3,5-epimerase
MGDLNVEPTRIPDVILLRPVVNEDSRGFFSEAFNARSFRGLGLPTEFVQDNHSGSKQGVLRGLHYQIQQPQGKLVRVMSGEVFDVAVDLRRSSGTFGQWVGERLSAENNRMMWIPAGFAHGFYTLSEWADVSYKVTDYYAPEWDRTLRWDDPELRIEWPLIDGAPPLLSKKDAQGVEFADAETFP